MVWGKPRVSKYKNKLKTNSHQPTSLLAKISYDLRTPLNVIIGFSEMLRHEKAGSINKEQREYLNDIIASAKDLLHLIQKTTAYSKKRELKKSNKKPF